MLFPGILRDVRGLSRRSLEVILNGHQGGKSHGCLHPMHSEPHPHVNQKSGWADLPPELLCDVIVRLEVSESTWPARKHVVACAAVCRSWRAICKEIVRSPELCGKLTFPVSLKQPGTRDGTIQCFIKRDKSSLTYHLFLCLSSALLVENGKFLLSAKRTRRTTSTEYVISMDPDNFSRSSSGYIGKLRSNFLGTKFTIYDTQATYDDTFITPPGRTGRRFNSKKLSPSIPTRSYSIAEVRYEQNMLGARGPRRVHCIMHSIPASALDAGGSVPHKPEVELLPRPLKGSFRGFSFPRCLNDPGQRCGTRYSVTDASQVEPEFKPLILKNKPPRWHEQLQCWCLNFRGRVTMASVKNFQLLAAREPTSSQATLYDCDKTILQFGKVGKDLFTMDYCYPLSAFQAFAICLSSFDTKLALE